SAVAEGIGTRAKTSYTCRLLHTGKVRRTDRIAIDTANITGEVDEDIAISMHVVESVAAVLVTVAAGNTHVGVALGCIGMLEVAAGRGRICCHVPVAISADNSAAPPGRCITGCQHGICSWCTGTVSTLYVTVAVDIVAVLVGRVGSKPGDRTG